MIFSILTFSFDSYDFSSLQFKYGIKWLHWSGSAHLKTNSLKALHRIKLDFLMIIYKWKIKTGLFSLFVWNFRKNTAYNEFT